MASLMRFVAPGGFACGFSSAAFAKDPYVAKTKSAPSDEIFVVALALGAPTEAAAITPRQRPASRLTQEKSHDH